MYELLGISLVLASLLTINALASVVAVASWSFLERPLRNCSARTRAEVLFAMRVGPSALALVSVALFLTPAYLIHEPYTTGEVVSKKLAVMAIFSAIGVAFAVWRALRSYFATRSLRREWLSHAVQIQLEGTSIPTFRISNAFPIVAVIGVLKPRLFIAEHVLETLTKEELTAAIAHECGHLAANDNFRRSLLRACRDVLMIVPSGRSLDRAWGEAAECAADEHAAQQNADTALSLASALVKIAKMVPLGARASVPMAAFLVGIEETAGVKARVRRLLEIASNADGRRVPRSSAIKIVSLTSLSLVFLLGAAFATNSHVLVAVHSLIEQAVRVLS